MPAASEITSADRNRRAARLIKAIDNTGLSRRAVARLIAAERDHSAATVETNFKRWTAKIPRAGAVDAAPDWIFEAIAEITQPTASEISNELREAIGRGYVSMKLASTAADTIDDLKKKVSTR